jgi:hypothetical protein
MDGDGSTSLWTAYAIALVATFISLFPLYWLFVSTKTA